MVLSRASQLIAPLESSHGLLRSEKLDCFNECNLAFFRAYRVAPILCSVNHSMEARERLLQVGDEALWVQSDFVLKRENLLCKCLPVHRLELTTALVIRFSVQISETFWQITTANTQLITLVNIEGDDLCRVDSNAAVFSFWMDTETCSEVTRYESDADVQKATKWK